MEEIIYENNTSKLIVNLSAELIELTQYLEGEKVGSVNMYLDEFVDLVSFVKKALT